MYVSIYHIRLYINTSVHIMYKHIFFHVHHCSAPYRYLMIRINVCIMY
jgi:hypothetical protein